MGLLYLLTYGYERPVTDVSKPNKYCIPKMLGYNVLRYFANSEFPAADI